MTFKEFRTWCNERACDGCWGFAETITCIDIMKKVQKENFWKREKVWQKEYAWYVVPNIVEKKKKKIKEFKTV